MSPTEAEHEVVEVVRMVDAAAPELGRAAFSEYLRACAEVRPLLKRQRRYIADSLLAEAAQLDEEIAARFQEACKRVSELIAEDPPF